MEGRGNCVWPEDWLDMKGERSKREEKKKRKAQPEKSGRKNIYRCYND